MVERNRKRSLAVYEAPPVPEGWHGHDVVRIIDPLGVQAAWVAPRLAGGLIAWFVRGTPGDAWNQVLGGTGDLLGGELLTSDPASQQLIAASDDAAGWGFIERDPTAVTVRGQVGERRMTVSLRCDDGLHIDAHAGDGTGGAGFRIRLHPGITTGARLTRAGNAIRFGPGSVASLDWHIEAGLRSVPVTARGAPWNIDIVPDEYAGHDPPTFGLVLTTVSRNDWQQTREAHTTWHKTIR